MMSHGRKTTEATPSRDIFQTHLTLLQKLTSDTITTWGKSTFRFLLPLLPQADHRYELS